MFVIIYLWVAICMQYYSLSECQEISRALHRLPKNVEPNSYDLTLWMPQDWNNFTYTGHVLIDICIIKESNSITLNIDGLIIYKDNTTLLNNRNESITILSQSFNDEKHFFIIEFNENLKVGNYLLSLLFNGEIRDDVFGFYRSQYKVGNEIKWIALTQFSPIFARRAFPCFDEPYLKATFKLHIGHSGNQTITSNTRREKSELIDTENYYLTTMERTPIMSTYLLGWAIHNFNYRNYSNSIPFGLWSRQSMMVQESLALKEGKLIYSSLELWMNTQNPIEKLEHIAVPDFNFHAMENWGMITFRESAVLFHPDFTPTKSIQDGLSTMAHEYAHTWFGNLVTPEFWNVAWLKEGFATYFSYFSRSLVYTNLRIMNLFVVENLHDVFQDDADEHNRTMNGRDTGAAEDALGYLDFSAYKKGAAIVRMVQSIMGEKSFQMALRSFLMSRSYNFATPTILYTHLRNYTEVSEKLQSHIDIGEIIETYANSPGYPLVTITRNYSSNLIQISQERFRQDPNSNHGKPLGWWIPINLVSKTQRKSNISEFGSIWMGPKDMKISININIDPMDWIICDIDKVGYYRINYDVNNWNILLKHLDSDEFSEINRIARATLVDDAFNLARGGYIDYKIPLQLGNYLKRETEYEPWLAAVKSLNFLSQILQDSSALHSSLQEYVKYILEPIYQSLTFNETEENEFYIKLLRNLILTTACKIRNGDCLTTATAIFRNWIGNSSEIVKPNLKSFVYCEGIRMANSDEWEETFRRFLLADLHIEKELLIKGLGCSTNGTLISQFLNFSITNNGPELPKQYRLTIVNNILDGGTENVYHTLTFISHNVKTIIRLRGHVFLKKVFNAIKQKITSVRNQHALSSLVDSNINHLGPSLKTAKDTIEYAKRTIAWIKKFSPIISEALRITL